MGGEQGAELLPANSVMYDAQEPGRARRL